MESRQALIKTTLRVASPHLPTQHPNIPRPHHPSNTTQSTLHHEASPLRSNKTKSTMPEDFANSTNGKKRSAPADDEVNSSKRHAPRAAYKSLKDTDFDAISHGGRFSDLVLKFREDTWKVHKYVLCTQSDFFGGCVESGMRVRYFFCFMEWAIDVCVVLVL